MEMVCAKPPLKDADQVKELCSVTNGAPRAGILCDDYSNVTLTDATKQQVETANDGCLLAEVANAGD